jgi:hypothetical protein
MSEADTQYQPEALAESGRKWIYPLIRKGPFYNYRSWLSYVYLLLFFSAPFLRIGGHPVLLLNVMERRFVILGQVFGRRISFCLCWPCWRVWFVLCFLP